MSTNAQPIKKPSQNSRHHSLDAIRAFMMLLGIVLHTALCYGQNDYTPHWTFKDSSVNFIFDLIVNVVHLFRIPVFYLLSGFFAALLCDKRGLTSFIKNRFSRITIPFVAFWIILVPIIEAAFALAKQKHHALDIHNIIQNLQNLHGNIWSDNTHHLWFLYYLMYFYMLTFIIQTLRHHVFIQKKITPALTNSLHLCLKHRFSVFILAIPTAIALSSLPNGVMGSPSSFVPHPGVILYYGTFFCFGWFTYLNQNFIALFREKMHLYTLIAITVYPLQYFLLKNLFQTNDTISYKFLFCYGNGLATWCAVFSVMGLLIRFFSQANKTIRYIVDASYWIYLIHLPIVVVSAWLIKPWTIPAGIKFLLVCAITSFLCLLSYDLFVRSTWIGKILNGKKHQRFLS